MKPNTRLALTSSYLVLALFTNSTLGAPANNRKMSFSCAAISAETPIYKKVEALYRQAFAQMGYDFEMIVAPNLKRSLAEARHGGSDGDCGRIGSLNEIIPNSHLVRIEVKLLETNLGVWTTDPTLHINSADAITAGNYSIGYTRGSLISESYVTKHKLLRAQETNSPEASIKMLVARRYDLLLMSPDIVIPELKRLHLDGKIFYAGTLDRYIVYPYLNENHKALIPQLETELKKLVPPQGIDLSQYPPR